MSDLPVVVIGAGPQGLAAAAHLLERGLEPVVLESGSGPGAAVWEWGHVRLFSEWPELIDQAAARLLAPTGWQSPTTGYPTGSEWVDRYLAPLATALGERVWYDARVTGVSRKGRDRLVDADRRKQPFTVHVTTGVGAELRIEARAVIDASGTWRKPNPAGADGLPSLGERANVDLISNGVPDSAHPEPFSGRHTVVLGAGDSSLKRSSSLIGSRARTRTPWSPGRYDVARRRTPSAAEQLISSLGAAHSDSARVRRLTRDASRSWGASAPSGLIASVTRLCWWPKTGASSTRPTPWSS